MSISESPDFIFETQFWLVELSYKQYYLGRSVVILKRDCYFLSQLTTAEFLDLQQIIQKLELATKQVFGAVTFNWTCLMNKTAINKNLTNL